MLILSFFILFNMLWKDERRIFLKEYEYNKENSSFVIAVKKRQGYIYYQPEKIVYEMTSVMIPEKTECESFYQEYVLLTQEQKNNFWQALEIINRTNLYLEWKRQHFPEKLILSRKRFCINDDFNGKNTSEAKKELLDDALSAQKVTQGIIVFNPQKFLPYFYLSVGKTRHQEGREIERECEKDKTNVQYELCTRIRKDIFAKKLNRYWGIEKFDIKNFEIKRDELDYIESLKIDQQFIDLDKFRRVFHIDSPCFFIEEQNNSFLITTKGIGHGYGLCVSYTLFLASKDKSYEEIIKYFFDEISLERKYGV